MLRNKLGAKELEKKPAEEPREESKEGQAERWEENQGQSG